MRNSFSSGFRCLDIKGFLSGGGGGHSIAACTGGCPYVPGYALHFGGNPLCKDTTSLSFFPYPVSTFSRATLSVMKIEKKDCYSLRKKDKKI
jgi:hypothetical protein